VISSPSHPIPNRLAEVAAVGLKVVLELRAQAFRVAEVIIADIHAWRAEVRLVEQTYADVLEYSI
jgi:hypothetical protein